MAKRFPMSLDLAKIICEASTQNILGNHELRHHVVLGRFNPAILSHLSLPDLDVVTSVSILTKLAKKHNLGPGVISGLHELIGKPSAVFKSASKTSSIVIVTMMTVDGNPLIASFETNVKDAYMKPNMHWMTSAYGKENHEKIKQWEANGLLLWRPEITMTAINGKEPKDVTQK